MSDKKVIPGVFTENGNPVYEGDWYAARSVGGGCVYAGVASLYYGDSLYLRLNGGLVHAGDMAITPIAPIKFAADIAAEKAEQERKAKREREVEVTLEVFLDHTGGAHDSIRAAIDALDKYRAEQAKETP